MKYLYALYSILLLISNTILGGFCSDTCIKTPTGYMAIKHIQVNDRVECFSLAKKITRSVIHTRSSIQKSCRCIVLPHQQKLIVSHDQKFYVPAVQAWKIARYLEPGEYLSNNKNELIQIQEVIDIEDAIELFELSLTGNHTFFITDQNILVHNAAPVVAICLTWLFGGGSVEFAGIGATLCALGVSIGIKWFADKKKKRDRDLVFDVTPGSLCATGGGAPDPNDPDPWEDKDKHNNKFPDKKPDNEPDKKHDPDKVPDQQPSEQKKISDKEKFEEAVKHATTETKLTHFFENNLHDHGFNRLLNQLGGIESIDAQKKLVEQIITELMKSGNLPAEGTHGEALVSLMGETINVRLFMGEGIIKIGTMFISS